MVILFSLLLGKRKNSIGIFSEFLLLKTKTQKLKTMVGSVLSTTEKCTSQEKYRLLTTVDAGITCSSDSTTDSMHHLGVQSMWSVEAILMWIPSIILNDSSLYRERSDINHSVHNI